MTSRKCSNWYNQVVGTISSPSYTVTTNVPPEDNDYFEMVDEVEVRELLSEVFLWLSGMGEYPEVLAQICPEGIVGNHHSENEDEREQVSEKCIAQILRWVLGEI